MNAGFLRIYSVIYFFTCNVLIPASSVHADTMLLPKPGVMVHLSPGFNPPVLKGIKVHTDNPFRFDFILDKGNSRLNNGQLKEESTKLIKYFLVSLTVPEKDLWVNLSPYEKNRIIANVFGLTEMGRDLLAQDYILKQLTASLIYPEDETGKKFWKRVYEEAEKKFRTTNIPVNTFNKVWIVPEKAVVYENIKAGTAYVVESRLKVMLEEDYLALEKTKDNRPETKDLKEKSKINALGSQIVREVVIPALTKEVNEGRNFALLRQVYHSLILAAWFKQRLKESFLGQKYADQNKINGINFEDPEAKEKIYEQYLKAFKRGVYNYIKEEYDPFTQQTIPKKYFSGGLILNMDKAMAVTDDLAMAGNGIKNDNGLLELDVGIVVPHGNVTLKTDAALLAEAGRSALIGSRLALEGNYHISNSRRYIANTLRTVFPDDEQLRGHIMIFMDQLEKETKNMAFLPPNLAHIERSLQNGRNLLGTHEELVLGGIKKEFGVDEAKAKNIAKVATILLKIGFGYRGPENRYGTAAKQGQLERNRYSQNRKVAIDMIDELDSNIKLFAKLGLTTEVQIGKFKEAIRRAGEFGDGPQYMDMESKPAEKQEARKKKYENALTAFLTLITEVDIGRDRLQDWQKSQVIMDAIFNILFNPKISDFYTERTKLEVEPRDLEKQRSKEDIQRDIDNSIEEGIESQIIAQENILKQRMIKRGEVQSWAEANQIFSHIKASIHAINSDTYLWLIGSYVIKEAKINEQGNVVVDVFMDRLTQLGAAANLEHIRNFRINQLKVIIEEINQKLGTHIEWKMEESRQDQGLYNLINRLWKADNHAHMKMSLNFDLIWKIILGEKITNNGVLEEVSLEAQEEERQYFMQLLTESEANFTKSHENVGGSQEQIGLIKLVGNIEWTVTHLEKLLNRHKYLCKKVLNREFQSKNKEQMVMDAIDLLNASKTSGESTMTIEDLESLNKLIGLYARLKTDFTNIFHYRIGGLPAFVQHFMATSKLYKKISNDESAVQKIIVEEVIKHNQLKNVAFIEQRYNASTDKQKTMDETLGIMHSFVKLKQEQEAQGKAVPNLGLTVSITKLPDESLPFKQREQNRYEGADSVMALRKQIVHNVLEGKLNQDFDTRWEGVSNRILLAAGLNLDAAGQEEYNDPALFYRAYQKFYDQTKELNAQLKNYYETEKNQIPIEQRIYFHPRGMTMHVSESIQDVSVETGMLNSLRMVFLNDIGINFNWRTAEAVLSRLGHSIAPWLDDYDQFLGKTKKERASERIKTIHTLINLLNLGVPLLNPALQPLPQGMELNKEQMILALNIELAKLLKLDPDEEVAYVYDKNRIQDLKTIAGFIRDVMIKHEIVIETNPTSNLGVSPYIPGYAEHTIKQLHRYRYRDWVTKNFDASKGTYAGRKLSENMVQKLQNYLNTPQPERLQARFTINTDDLTLLGTDLVEEIYRVAVALGLSKGEVADIVQEGFRSRFSTAPLSHAQEIEEQYIERKMDMPHNNIESFANLSKKFQGEKNWENMRDHVAISLGLYVDHEGNVHLLSPKTNIETMRALLRSPFGETLSLEQLHALATHNGVITVDFKTNPSDPEKEFLFQEGAKVTDLDGDDDVYLVLKGEFDIIQKGNFVAASGPGSIVGEVAVAIGNQPRTASVKPKHLSRALRIPRSLFQGLLLSHDKFRDKIAGIIKERIKILNLPVEERRLYPLVMRLEKQKDGAWNDFVPQNRNLPDGFSTENANQVVAQIFKNLQDPDNPNYFSGQIPDLKTVVITDSGRFISVYEDPSDGRLFLVLSYKFFKGKQPEATDRITWALHHQLLYLSADIPPGLDKEERAVVEGKLILEDLLADDDHHQIPQAIQHLNYFINLTPEDETLKNSLINLEKIYRVYEDQPVARTNKINEPVIKSLLADVFQMQENLVNNAFATSTLRQKLLAEGLISRELQLTDAATLAQTRGGIDFNTAFLKLQAQGPRIKFNMAELRELEQIPVTGFSPVILQMIPVVNIKTFLGL